MNPMKMTTTVTVLANILMFLQPAVAAPVKGHDLKALMNQEVPAKINLSDLGAQMSLVSSKLAKSNRNKAHNATLTASLGRQIMTVVDGADVPVSVIDIGAALVRARDVLNETEKQSGSLDKESKEFHANLKSAVQVYAEGLGLVVSRIKHTDSEEAKAIGKILVIGKQIARGQVDTKQSKTFVDLMSGMTSILENQKNFDLTAEQALTQTIEKLDYRKKQKIDEILATKI